MWRGNQVSEQETDYPLIIWIHCSSQSSCSEIAGRGLPVAEESLKEPRILHYSIWIYWVINEEAMY